MPIHPRASRGLSGNLNISGASRTGSHAQLHQHNKKAPEQRKASKEVLTDEARLAAIRGAQVWHPTDIPTLNVREGPEGPEAFAPNALVACDYVEKKLTGTSRKFDCDVGDGDIVKVRYGEVNGKVEGSVLASRLLWVLGFGADRIYPVRVQCRGCSDDPWNHHETIPDAVRLFDPAAIDREPIGHALKSADHPGWAWPELDLVEEQQGGAPKAQRDALTLLAVFMQHTDSKPDQQKLVCLDDVTADSPCRRPFMLVHDVGLTFGHANFWNRTITGSVNFEQWSKTPIWRDAAACRAHLSKSATGTLGDDPRISEAGRQFLANLLTQLTDRQLDDLFDVARVDRRSRKPNSHEPPASVNEWVAAFKRKRTEIVNARCPS